MSDGGSIIEKINSKEIENLILKIYNSEPENYKLSKTQNEKHDEIIKYVDAFEKQKFNFWKKIRR